MSKELNVSALLRENTDYMSMHNEVQPLVRKWKKTGLLENLDTEFEINSMAVMLENQAKRLIYEATTTSQGTAGTEAWSGVALPLVRRIFGEMAAKEFVSVQPMNLPSGLVFFLDLKYASNGAQPGFTAGTSVFGGTNTGGAANFGRTNDAVNGFYGAGRFGNTSNELYAQVTSTTGSATAATFRYDTRYDSVSASYFTLSVATSSLTKLDIDAPRAAVVANSGSVNGASTAGSPVIQGFLPEFTTITAAGNIVFVVSGSGFGAGSVSSSVQVSYLQSTTQDNRGDFEDLNIDISAAPNKIPGIDLSMRSEPIVAKTKKMKAQWTPEMAQDLNSYHSVDAEAELTNMLSEYVTMELDLEILDMLIANALTTDKWSVSNNETWNGSNWVTPTSTSQTGFYNTQGAWFATLGTKMKKISNTIHQLTMRGGANFVVLSPTAATILDSIPGYSASDRGAKYKYAMGVNKAGSMSNQYDVYINPYMTGNLILMGFRGSQFLETGAVYAPYIPLMMTPLVFDPVTYTPNRGVMTRYAKKMLRPEFFGYITVKDLGLI